MRTVLLSLCLMYCCKFFIQGLLNNKKLRYISYCKLMHKNDDDYYNITLHNIT